MERRETQRLRAAGPEGALDRVRFRTRMAPGLGDGRHAATVLAWTDPVRQGDGRGDLLNLVLHLQLLRRRNGRRRGHLKSRELTIAVNQ